MSEHESVWTSSFAPSAQRPLKTYFGRVRAGSNLPNDGRTTFYKGTSPHEVLKEWDRMLKAISQEWPTLYEFENDLRNKVGPLSFMRPLDERMDDIDAYYDLISLKSKPISERAIKAVQTEWGAIGALHVRDQISTWESMKKSTSAGSPYMGSKSSVASKTIPAFVYMDGQQCKQILKYKTLPLLTASIDGNAEDTGLDKYSIPAGIHYNAPAVLGWRGQEGGPSIENTKQRVVWMFPFAVNLQELQVYQPLIEAVQRLEIVPAWVSNERVDREITLLFDTKDPEDLVICTDFSKFDQHFNASMQSAARDVLRHLLRGPDGDEWLSRVFPIKYQIPLAFDYGEIRYGKHGMGSGSGGTNADETMAHRCLQYEAAIMSNQRLNVHSQCLGDDGIISYPGITVEDVVRSYSSHGQEMNPDKQYASKSDCVYLRRWHHEDYRIDDVCVGVYSTFRALGKLMYTERYVDPKLWGPKQVALRQLSIIENCKYHPMRDQFARYCMKGDIYRLGVDIPGFLDNIEEEAKKIMDDMPDFLGYTKSLQNQRKGKLNSHINGGDDYTGIASWWIIDFLKKYK